MTYKININETLCPNTLEHISVFLKFWYSVTSTVPIVVTYDSILITLPAFILSHGSINSFSNVLPDVLQGGILDGNHRETLRRLDMLKYIGILNML